MMNTNLLAQFSTGWMIVTGIVGLTILTLLIVLAQFFRLWLQAFMSNAEVSILDLIGMRLRKVDATTIVLC